MSLISTKGKIPSEVIAYELFEEFGYCRLALPTKTLVAANTLAVDGFVMGSVVIKDGAFYRLLVAGDNAGIASAVLAVVVDPKVTTAVDGDKLVCLVNGTCGVRNLNYGGATAGGVNTRLAVLGIRVEEAVSVTLA